NTAADFSGVIQGSGFVHKVGTAVQSLLGANTYTGATWVHEGTLRLAGPNGRLTAPISESASQPVLLPGGTFTFDNSIDNVTYTVENPGARLLGTPSKFGVSLRGGTLQLLGKDAETSLQDLGPL